MEFRVGYTVLGVAVNWKAINCRVKLDSDVWSKSPAITTGYYWIMRSVMYDNSVLVHGIHASVNVKCIGTVVYPGTQPLLKVRGDYAAPLSIFFSLSSRFPHPIRFLLAHSSA